MDIDPKSGGDLSLTDLIEAYGDEWLDTLKVRTGSGGFHFFSSIRRAWICATRQGRSRRALIRAPMAAM
jgi:hypothetical protein